MGSAEPSGWVTKPAISSGGGASHLVQSGGVSGEGGVHLSQRGGVGGLLHLHLLGGGDGRVDYLVRVRVRVRVIGLGLGLG